LLDVKDAFGFEDIHNNNKRFYSAKCITEKVKLYFLEKENFINLFSDP
jgi:hypothetical protein